MQLPRPVGREAASRKYDILSALMAFALAKDKHVQRLVLRIMVLITTRYNWQRDELSMGQGEIAALWSVDERTVKREMAKLRSQGWLVLKRQGARGRVSLYGLDLARMMEDTRPVWPHLGADFAARIEPPPSGAGGSNVVPLRASPAPSDDGGVWTAAQALLHAADPASYSAWFHLLSEVGIEAGCMMLTAPSRFHARYVETHLSDRVLTALRTIEPSLQSVQLVVD